MEISIQFTLGTININMKLLLGLFLIVSSSFGQNFVDICNDSSGNECCASEGMEDHTYWVMQSSGSWSSLDIECRIQKTGARLAVFETRRENDCMIKYLLDEYRGRTVIALDSKWHSLNNSAPEFAAIMSFTRQGLCVHHHVDGKCKELALTRR